MHLNAHAPQLTEFASAGARIMRNGCLGPRAQAMQDGVVLWRAQLRAGELEM